MTSASAAPFVPPTPPRLAPAGQINPATRAYGMMRFFRVMARNPLEIWSDGYYREPVLQFRFMGSDYLVVHDPDAIRQVFVTHQDRYRFSYVRQAILKPFLGDGLVVAEGETWKRARKALTPVFTPRHVRGFADVMTEVAAERAEALAGRAGETVELSGEMLHWALDILLACLFSRGTRLDTDLFSDRINRLIAVSGLPHPFDLLKAPSFVPRVGRGEASRLVRDMRAQVGALAAARRERLAAGESVPEDFLSLLLQAGVEDGEPLSDTEIIDNLLTFLSAGHETTARTLTWTFYLLAKAPAVLARVLEELDALDADTAPADLAEAMPYTQAVLKESMRLYPAAAQLSREAVSGDVVAGREVTPGMEIITSTWVLHRHQLLWDDPAAFRPERFMGEAGAAIPRNAYLPFGLGPRVCIGASFSMQEMMIVLKQMLSRFTLEHAGGPDPVPVMRITLQPSVPIPMRIVAR